jgi:hypothetical protein
MCLGLNAVLNNLFVPAGLQERNVSCVKAGDDNELVSVPDSQCEGYKPSETQACNRDTQCPEVELSLVSPAPDDHLEAGSAVAVAFTGGRLYGNVFFDIAFVRPLAAFSSFSEQLNLTAELLEGKGGRALEWVPGSEVGFPSAVPVSAGGLQWVPPETLEPGWYVMRVQLAHNASNVDYTPQPFSLRALTPPAS